MRSELRLSDLKSREPVSTRLLNVKIPSAVDEQIAALAEQLGASKTEVVVVLLNEGLGRVEAAKGRVKKKGRAS